MAKKKSKGKTKALVIPSSEKEKKICDKKDSQPLICEKIFHASTYRFTFTHYLSR